MTTATSFTEREIASQPALWDAMRARADVLGPDILGVGRALVMGCGTSAFVAQSLATLRESAGRGETDWCYASEPPAGRRYDHVIALSRSGTTTEVIDALRRIPPTTSRVAVVGVGGAISATMASLVDRLVVLEEADEQSVVQTRFPTSVLALVRAATGTLPKDIVAQCQAALSQPLPDTAALTQFVMLGRGWTLGLAHEAALKLREMARAWSESYPALDFRHGPIAVPDERTLVMAFGDIPGELVAEIAATGAHILHPPLDPLCQLVVAQRVALQHALLHGFDPDRPYRLVRSVVLDR